MADSSDPLAKFSDEPLLTADVRAFLDELDEARDDDRCQYAIDTLDGIRASVLGRLEVTEGQRTALANIVTGSRKREGTPNYGRRYEGFRRR